MPFHVWFVTWERSSQGPITHSNSWCHSISSYMWSTNLLLVGLSGHAKRIVVRILSCPQEVVKTEHHRFLWRKSRLLCWAVLYGQKHDNDFGVMAYISISPNFGLIDGWCGISVLFLVGRVSDPHNSKSIPRRSICSLDWQGSFRNWREGSSGGFHVAVWVVGRKWRQVCLLRIACSDQIEDSKH